MSDHDQPSVFGRDAELASIRMRLANRTSFLLHGPAGIGKTLLIRRVLHDLPDALYCSAAASPKVILRALAELLVAPDGSATPRVRRTPPLLSKSIVALKGIVLDALRASAQTVVLDHLACPSSAVASVVREVMGTGSSVVSMARSAHMEDAGHVLPLYPFREERVEVRPFEARTAREFADRVADSLGIVATNRDEFLDRVIACSKGNPGAIIEMLRKGTEEKYRAGGHIKIAPLYVDFRLEWNAVHR